jgi:hypothetical protein
MIDFDRAVTAWHALYEAQVRPIHSQADYETMLEFLRELIRTKNVDQEPYKSLWAMAAQLAANWEKEHDPWLMDEETSNKLVQV